MWPSSGSCRCGMSLVLESALCGERDELRASINTPLPRARQLQHSIRTKGTNKCLEMRCRHNDSGARAARVTLEVMSNDGSSNLIQRRAEFIGEPKICPRIDQARKHEAIPLACA